MWLGALPWQQRREEPDTGTPEGASEDGIMNGDVGSTPQEVCSTVSSLALVGP